MLRRSVQVFNRLASRRSAGVGSDARALDRADRGVGKRPRRASLLAGLSLAALLLAAVAAYQALPLQAQTSTEVTAPNDWSLKPAGLGVGDKFRLLFLSSTTPDATSTDIAVYNTWAQGRATAGHDEIQDYSAGFRVVGCTADVDARDNTGANTNTNGVPIYWLNGSKVAVDNTDFYNGAWANEADDKNNGPLGFFAVTSASSLRPMYGLSRFFTVVSSTDATLSDLSLENASNGSAITLSPGFSSGHLDYSASVGFPVSQVTVIPTTNHAQASIRYLNASNEELGDGDRFQLFLSQGAEHFIKVEVTAENGTPQTYTLTVTRAGRPGQVLLSQQLLSLTEGNRACYLADDPPALERLAVPEDEAEGWRLYPAFDPAVRHYALRCGYRESLTLQLAAADPDTRVTVDGQPVAGDGGEAFLDGLAGDDDIVIGLRSGGAASSYVLHCLADDFPEITATSRPGVSDGLILVSVWMQDEDRSYFSWIAMIDNHGVPRFQRRIDGLVNTFKPQPNADLPFSYGREAGYSENPRDAEWRSFEFVLLDRALEPVRVVRTAAPLTHTDIHDFVVRENGNVAFLAYEPAQRDLSAITGKDGAPYDTDEAVEDSVIQEVAPDGREVMRWNSRDHLAPEDCTQHRFPWDYAHVNSLQYVEGDIVASFRGCSQVLRIDGESGEVVWRLGRSNRDWPRPPLAIVGDPYGEFCGQHSARLLPEGRLLLFDNGGHCQVDPASGRAEHDGEQFSRVVEYALDPGAGTATFVRHHGLHGEFERYARSWGGVQELANGNWLISWGRGGRPQETPPPPDVTLTEIDPATGEELLAVRIEHDGKLLTSQAYRVGFEVIEGDMR